MAADGLTQFADAVLHELRTPLSVIAGEIDLALARDRPASVYREALARISESVAELADLTSDLALVAAPAPGHAAPRTTALAVVSAALAERYGERRGVPVAIDLAHANVELMGSAEQLVGALALLVEHALKHRTTGADVRLQVCRPDDRSCVPGAIALVLEATPHGLSPKAWEALATAEDGERDQQRPTPRGLRLQAAARLVQACGGSLVFASGPQPRLVIGLRAVASAIADGAGPI